jgi:hypothetical protein
MIAANHGRAIEGAGRILTFTYWPGVTYWNSTTSSPDRLPANWAVSTRKVLTAPARLAGAKKHVELSSEVVEGALLESDKGIAVTLLNWSGTPQQQLTVTVPGIARLADAQKARRLKVESAIQGALKYEINGNTLTVTLPLRAVDVVMISL